MPYKLVFMGTPDFAVPALQAVHAAGHDIALVVTQPDRPKGRGRKVEPPPVKKASEKLGLAVTQPDNLRSETAKQLLQAADADFFIVVAFGHLLRESVLKMPKRGCINVHASLLPRHRGPAPIQWAVINGDTETGVTTMLMDKGLDTGDMLMAAREPIGPSDTAGSLHDRLAQQGADLLVQTLAAFADGTIRRTPQDHSAATYAPLLKKTDGLIDWKKPAAKIEPFIRGMSPWPGAFTFWKNTRLKIYRSEIEASADDALPGTVLNSRPNRLIVSTGDGALSILELQSASGSRLPVSEFLRGFRITPGEFLA
ncbi:MAG TPA: methionyl-tRNA formyltransferase [Desulfobacterales bacterium]|jgi:methionyl-tRNA formyltransferase|nr:methionyl-tRNA formyltransferase [Desulfobacterales bacterium]HSM89441.1 methionyl-tRNA formyltransferase [Desulfobacterales bacterium]